MLDERLGKMSDSIGRLANTAPPRVFLAPPPPPPPAPPPSVRQLKKPLDRVPFSPSSNAFGNSHSGGGPLPVQSSSIRGRDQHDRYSALPAMNSPQAGASAPPAINSPRIAATATSHKGPQQQDNIMARLLKGLEENDLTVHDVLGALDTEIKKPQVIPGKQLANHIAGAPLDPIQMAAIQPALAGSDRKVNALLASPAMPQQSVLPQQLQQELSPQQQSKLQPSPNSDLQQSILPLELQQELPQQRSKQQPSPNSAGSTASASKQYPSKTVVTPSVNQWGCNRCRGLDSNNFVMDCARCPILEKQLRAVSQALAGLSATIFNWSLGPLQEEVLQGGLSRYLTPDEKIVLWELVLKYIGPCAHVDERIGETCSGFQGALSTASQRPPRLESQQSGTSPYRSQVLEAGPIVDGQQFATASRTLDASKAVESTSNGLPVAVANSAVISNPITDRRPTKGDVVEVSITFESSTTGRVISGLYRKSDGAWAYERPVYVSERDTRDTFTLLYNGRAWVVKSTSGDDPRAVLAYVEDAASEPYEIASQWRTADGSGGFLVEPTGCVLPGGTRGDQGR